MQRFPAFAAALAAIISATSLAAASDITSIYSSTAAKDCRKMPVAAGEVDADDSAQWTCRGPAGLVVVKTEGDLRETITVGRTVKAAEDEPAASQGFAAFNSTTDTIEWRLSGGKPFAMIQRWHVAIGDGSQSKGAPKTRQVLVVTRLPPGAVCHVAHIDVSANPDANEVARKAADKLARGFDCSKGKVSVAGIGDRATALAMASR
ncbi:hypothetical protein [Tardiphaga sp. 813_E8_N1_3]|uniref:hypothetical protein n=1 Tax=Tardiphaga sp. 813_E8_N1_3 TaxID=3240760 RepID=UPI003F23325C